MRASKEVRMATKTAACRSVLSSAALRDQAASERGEEVDGRNSEQSGVRALKREFSAESKIFRCAPDTADEPPAMHEETRQS